MAKKREDWIDKNWLPYLPPRKGGENNPADNLNLPGDTPTLRSSMIQMAVECQTAQVSIKSKEGSGGGPMPMPPRPDAETESGGGWFDKTEASRWLSELKSAFQPLIDELKKIKDAWTAPGSEPAPEAPSNPFKGYGSGKAARKPTGDVVDAEFEVLSNPAKRLPAPGGAGGGGMGGGGGLTTGAAAEGGGVFKSIAGAAGRGAAGLGRILGSVASKAIPVIGMFAAVSVAGYSAAKSLLKMSADALEAQRHLAEMSGEMATVFALRDIREQMRNMETGKQLAPSAMRLADSEQNLKDAVAPFERSWSKIKNNVMSIVNNIMAKVVNVLGAPFRWLLEGLAKLTDKIAEWLNVNKKLDGAPMGKWVKEVAEETRRKLNDHRRQMNQWPRWNEEFDPISGQFDGVGGAW